MSEVKEEKKVEDKKDENAMDIEDMGIKKEKIEAILNNPKVRNIDNKKSSLEEKLKFKKVPKVKQISTGQEKLNEIIKNKKVNSDLILSNYLTVGLIENESDAIFFEKLAKSIISNYKLSINDILSNKKFTIVISAFNTFTEKNKIFTNDKLYWLSLISELLDAKYEKMKGYVDFENMKIYLCSKLEEISDEYKRYYVRDYSGDFSFVGMELFSAEDKTKIKKGEIEGFFGDATTFEYQHVKYAYFKAKNNTARYVIKDDLKGNAADYFKKIEIFDSKKKMEKDKIDVHKIKTEDNKTNIYLSQFVNYVDFCPSELCFENEVNYEYYVKCDIKPLDLETNLLKESKDKNPKKITEYINIKGLVDWDSVDLFVNFLVVESTTVFKVQDNAENYKTLISKINDFIKDYQIAKPYFAFVRSDINKMLSFLLSFFQSFQTRINFESINKLNKKFKPLLKSLEQIRTKKFSETIESFIDAYDLKDMFITIYNTVKNNFAVLYNIFSSIDLFFTSFENRDSELITELRKIGLKIFSIMRLSDTDETYLIDSFLTPALFLGGLLENEKFLAQKLETKIEIEEKKEMKEKEKQINALIKSASIRETGNPLEKYIAYFLVLNTGDNEVINDGAKDIKNKGLLTDVAKSWFEEAKKDNKIFSKEFIDTATASAVSSLANETPFDYDLPGFAENLKSILESYNQFVAKKGAEAKLMLADLTGERLKLNQNIASLESGKLPLLPVKGEVTLEKLTELGIKPIGKDEVNKIVYQFVENARKKGVTDDIIKDILVEKNGLNNFDEIISEIEVEIPEEDMVNKGVKETQEKWGINGTAFLQKLRETGNEVKKKKVMKFAPEKSLGNKKKRNKNKKFEKKE